MTCHQHLSTGTTAPPYAYEVIGIEEGYYRISDEGGYLFLSRESGEGMQINVKTLIKYLTFDILDRYFRENF